MSVGGFVVLSAGMRHGYRDVTAILLEMVVTFVPGGFEELLCRTGRTRRFRRPVLGSWRMRRGCLRRRSSSRRGTLMARRVGAAGSRPAAPQR